MKENQNATLKGVILSGGDSSRMGADKSKLKYHRVPQVEHLFHLLGSFVSETYVSVRNGQSVSFTENIIEDKFEMKGPINGIMSAFDYDPAVAWVVVAVDLPLLTAKSIEQLKANRNPEKVATALSVKGSNQPEPLLSIWEPIAYSLLTKDIDNLGYSPMRFLMSKEVQLVDALDDSELFNANDRADYMKAKNQIDSFRDK